MYTYLCSQIVLWHIITDPQSHQKVYREIPTCSIQELIVVLTEHFRLFETGNRVKYEDRQDVQVKNSGLNKAVKKNLNEEMISHLVHAGGIRWPFLGRLGHSGWIAFILTCRYVQGVKRTSPLERPIKFLCANSSFNVFKGFLFVWHWLHLVLVGRNRNQHHTDLYNCVKYVRYLCSFFY